MRRNPDSRAPGLPSSRDDQAELESQKQELLRGLEAGAVELRPFYWDLRNNIVRPWETVQTTRYFWFRWAPVLGPTCTVIVIHFRLLCSDRMSRSESPNSLVLPHAELAELCGMSLPTVKRLLSPRTFASPEYWFLPLFLRPFQRYTYDQKKRKKVRAPNGYEVAMDDPLLPKDEEALRGLYAEEEIRRMIKEGVVDLHNYAKIRAQRPKDQNDPQVPTRPRDQNDPQVGQDQNDPQVAHRDPQVQPSRTIGKPPKDQDQNDPQVAYRDPQVQPSRTIGKPPKDQDQNDPTSSSSSRSIRIRKTTTATTVCLGDQIVEPPVTSELLVTAIVEKFEGHVSRKTARQLVERHGFENVRDQLRYFDYRDNSWAEKGPAAAFATYCRNETAMPEAYEEAVDVERQQLQEEAEWRVAPIEERMEHLLSRWEALYRTAAAPGGEPAEPLPDEVDDLVDRLLPCLQQGLSKRELTLAVEREAEDLRALRAQALECYERDFERALAEHRKGLREADLEELAEETKRRALERGGAFVRRHMPRALLEAIEREVLCEQVRGGQGGVPAWAEYWRRFRSTTGCE